MNDLNGWGLDQATDLNDVIATVSHQLGIDPDPDLTITDELGRPIRIQPEASPISELL